MTRRSTETKTDFENDNEEEVTLLDRVTDHVIVARKLSLLVGDAILVEMLEIVLLQIARSAEKPPIETVIG